ncbi:protein kinase domain-containing protein [Ramlibacter pallidus]|uniref:Protein kinase n=1 Tax=Ramlibacter pallidus TaxID=2780087 RepID=A0ABR9RXY6_9BURK|nr:protein kinase [Ramlibacter pallidus]MBE7366102.1 protein kinase [Ramlibacter pallidus]
MTSILVVEDDDAIRGNLARLLRMEGYEVTVATNGIEGLERARALRPDVVISDINMPGMDGFALVEALRADAALQTTVVMMLTALDDRASMRRGMRSGADDYLAKPFTRTELLDALDALLKKRGRIELSIHSAVQAREEHLRRAFTASLGGQPLTHPAALDAPADAVPDQVLQATVLFSDIRNFTSLAEKLSSAEVAELLTQYFERTSDPVLRHGGRHLKFVGDGLMAVFADTMADAPIAAARRGLAAGLAIALATHEFRSWLDERFGGRGLPAFAVGVGLHAGEVTICRIGAGDVRETTAIGDTVNAAARLQGASKELGWTVVASSAVLQEAGEGVETGGMTSLEVRGRNGWLDVAEIVGLAATNADLEHGMAAVAERADEIRRAVEINSEITARAVKGALRSKLSTLRGHQFQPGDAPLRLKGFRLTRKLASGGMTEVYLAQRDDDGLPVVLKVLEASAERGGANLARFIQEYALLSRVDHAHVIRIYDQGFSDDHAYIAMEYFERGDLRSELRGGMARERVLDVVRQIALALEAIHAGGIIHRDLKPENVMLRPDGSVALADFGVAKSLLQDEALALTQTRHGEVVGTPFYLSPEQATGGAITPASDLYSLGVMLYEMLTGSRPYSGETLDLLLARHLTAPVPQLPQEFAGLQPVLDKLMAKRPADRYASAREFLAALDELPLLRTLATR